MEIVVEKELNQPHPVTVTTHYLRPGVPDTHCDINVEVVRTGRSFSTARATLTQRGKPRLSVLATFGDLTQSMGSDKLIHIAPPEIPGPESCVERDGAIQQIHLPITQRVDARLHPEMADPLTYKNPDMLGWIRFQDGRAPDPRSLLLFCDAFPPSVLGAVDAVGWVPTVELTVHVLRPPEPGWIQATLNTDSLVMGRMIETGTLWDQQGNLVAQSRQIGLVVPRDE